jgi:hypothetical protein
MTNLTGAILRGCHVYGVSAWDVELKDAEQGNLRIRPDGGYHVTVDRLDVAHFVYSARTGAALGAAIDAMTDKLILILGRFTKERKPVLNLIRDELRHRRPSYSPVVFDFKQPTNQDLTGAVETLARLARFIIVDLTDPSSVPHELATLTPFLRKTPIVPLRLSGTPEYSMFKDLRAYSWVLEVHEYSDADSLKNSLPKVIAEAEKLVVKLRS